MKLSIVINADTRPPNNQALTMFDGVRNDEVLERGIWNKMIAFQGFDYEIIVFIDEHEPMPKETLARIRMLAGTVVVRQHSKKYRQHESFPKFNDLNYLEALSLARGDVIIHFDGDAFIFSNGPEPIKAWLAHLEQYKYVSYPSQHSPNPVVDDSFDHWWVSTRTFACKADTFDPTEIRRCLNDPAYMWEKYGEKKRKLDWLEHVLGITSGSSVFYPPLDNSQLIIGCWGTYYPGIYQILHSWTFEQVHQYVAECGGLVYPNDLHAKPLNAQRCKEQPSQP